MTPARLPWIAAIGYLAFALAFKLNWRAPQDWNRIDLPALSSRAVRLVEDMTNFDVSNWTRQSAPRMDHALDQWRRSNGREPIDGLLTPLYVVITFRDPLSTSAVEVMLAPDGHPRGIRFMGPPRQHPEVKDFDVEAEAALTRLAGSFATRFEPETGRAEDRDDRFRWTAKTSSPSLVWRASVNLDRGRFHAAHIEPVFQGAAQPGRFLQGGGYDAMQGLVMLIAGVWCVFAYLSGWARRIMDHRLAFTAGGVFLLFDAAGRLAAGDRAAALSWLGMLVAATGVAMTTGAGRLAASGHEWPRWQSFVLFLRFHWKTNGVGVSVLTGLAWAGAVAAVPFLAAGIFPDAALNVATYGAPTLARWPAVASLVPLIERGVYSPLVLFAPLIFRRWLVARTALIVLAAAVALGLFAAANPFSAGVEASLVSAVCAAALLTAIYYLHGLLAVLTAYKTATVLTAIAGLLSAGLFLPASLLMALLAALAAASLWAARRGRHLEPQDDRNISYAYLSPREKLKAEFSLAHQAQQRMLPGAAPPLEGFTLAAACQPARDVGGDLYDYFPLPDGRLGICVADVSGKGMPAALYMTLTKGVLAAASPECGDLAQLAQHLNRHLYAAGKRKIFVTAVLAAVDAATRSVEFVRAGHNPILLRCAASGSARYLAAKGLGLGMTGGPLFARATAVERFTLDPGDTLVLYSDGVTEAMNARLEQYGEDRLKSVVERSGSAAPAGVLALIREDVAAFTGAEPVHDDITIVVLQAAPNGAKG